MPTMHNRQRWGITERQLDRIQHERQTFAAHAAQQIIERSRERQGICPPCTGNCAQGDACPARLVEQRLADQRAAAAQAKVEADRELSDLPTGKWALLAYVAFCGGIVLASHAYAAGWFQ